MLSINISELVLTIINFFLLLFLLNKFLYTPVLKFMQARQARIDDALAGERAAGEEVAANEERVDQARTRCREQARGILAQQRAEDAKRHGACAKQLLADNAQARLDARARVEAMAEETRGRFESEKGALAQLLADRLTGK